MSKSMRLLKSFYNAGRGIGFVFNSEKNFRFQVIVGILTLGAAFYFPLLNWERILLILLVAFVLIMEMVNTAVEYINDLLKPRLHHYVYIVKDIMAGAVFISALLSLIIGLIIFIPHFIKLFE